MSTQIRSKRIRTVGWLIWLCTLASVMSWLGLHFLRASAETNTISIISMEPTQSAQAESYSIGDKVTFVFSITNPTDNWLTVLPLSATFDSTYLAWVSGQPTPTLEQAGNIEWSDLTDLIGDIPPKQDTPITITFQTVSTTVHLPGGVTSIAILLSEGKADPDGSGPIPGNISLPDVTFDLSVAVNEVAGPPATPLGIERSPDSVTIAWQTNDESNILGFNLIRTYESGAHEQVNNTLLVAEYAGEPNGAQYAIADPGYKLLDAVTYQLEVELVDNSPPITTNLGILDPVSIVIEPTSVDLTSQGIRPQWQATDETYIQGFDLFRYDLAPQVSSTEVQIGNTDPQLTQINESLIPALSSGQPTSNTYSFADHSTRIGGGGGYGYKLRVILRNGESLMVDIGSQGPVEINITGEILDVANTGITVGWHSSNELLITGFNLWRSDETNASTQLNHNVFDAKQKGIATGAEYNYSDWSADPYKSYVYTVEALLIDGSSIHYELPASTAFTRVYLPTVIR